MLEGSRKKKEGGRVHGWAEMQPPGQPREMAGGGTQAPSPYQLSKKLWLPALCGVLARIWRHQIELMRLILRVCYLTLLTPRLQGAASERASLHP